MHCREVLSPDCTILLTEGIDINLEAILPLLASAYKGTITPDAWAYAHVCVCMHTHIQ